MEHHAKRFGVRRTTIVRLIATTALAALVFVPASAGAQAEDHILPLMPIQGSWGLVEDRPLTAPELGFPDGYASAVWMRRWTDGAESIIVALAESPNSERTGELLAAVRSERERSIVGSVPDIGGSFAVAEPAGTFSSGIIYQRSVFVVGVWGTTGVADGQLADVAVAQADYIAEAMRATAQAELDAAAAIEDAPIADSGSEAATAAGDTAADAQGAGATENPGPADPRAGTPTEAPAKAASHASPAADGPAVLRILIPFLVAFAVGAAAGRLTNLAVGRTVGNPWAVGVGAVSATWAIILAQSFAKGFDLADVGAYTTVAGVLIVLGVNLSYRIRNPWTPNPIYVDVAAIEAHLAGHASNDEIIRVAADPFS
jgi:hypothetical protein